MDYSISVLSKENIDEITAIVLDSLKEDFPQYKSDTIRAYSKSVFNKKYFVQILNEKKNAIIGAIADKKLIGLIVIKVEYGGVFFIDWLVVKKGYRKSGIGSLLIEETAKWAIINKYHYGYLFTESKSNINFYKKRGFIYVGKHKNFWFGENEYILGKSYKSKPFKEIFIT